MWKLAFDLQGRCAENEAEDCSSHITVQGDVQDSEAEIRAKDVLRQTQ